MRSCKLIHRRCVKAMPCRVISKIEIAPLPHATFSYVHGRSFPSTLTVTRTALHEHIINGGVLHRRFNTVLNGNGTRTLHILRYTAKRARGNNRTCTLNIVLRRQFVRPSLRRRVVCSFSLTRHSQISFT